MNALTSFKPDASRPDASRPVAASRHMPSAARPNPLPFLLTLLLAAALGASLGGVAAAAAMAGAVALFLMAPLMAAPLARAAGLAWMGLRPLVGLVLLPPVAIFTLALSVLLLAWDRTAGRFDRLALSSPIAPLALLRTLRRLLTGLFAAENLPLTAVNALLLVVLGCVGIGIEVAFYAALAAVPVLIIALVMLAIESSREPQDGPGVAEH